jgi:hypothetical protein
MQEITLDRLFRATKQVDIAESKLTVRALTDVERNMVFRSANLARAKMARKLDNPESDEALTHFGIIHELNDQDIRQVIRVYQNREAHREAQDSIKLSFVPFPDEATPDETDKVILRREDNVKKMQADRDKFVTDWMASVEKRITEAARPELLAEYRKAIRDTVLFSEYAEELEVQTLRISLDGQLSETDIRGLASPVRNLLMSSVSEVNTIDPLAWKSPVSTASSPEAPA